MKKLLYAFVLLGLFTFAAPIIANACTVRTITCDNGYVFAACCYDDADEEIWKEVYCPPPPPA